MSWTGGTIQNLANHQCPAPDVLLMTYLIISVSLPVCSSRKQTDYIVSRLWLSFWCKMWRDQSCLSQFLPSFQYQTFRKAWLICFDGFSHVRLTFPKDIRQSSIILSKNISSEMINYLSEIDLNIWCKYSRSCIQLWHQSKAHTRQ